MPTSISNRSNSAGPDATRDSRSDADWPEQGFERETVRNVVADLVIVDITDPSGIILDVNDAFCRVSGYDRAQLVGQTHRIINSGYHAQSFWEDLWRTIAGGGVWRDEICNRAKDGALFWLNTTISPLRGASGAIRGYVACRVDVTARKRADGARLEGAERLRVIIDAAFDAVVLTDEQGAITEWNAQSERTFGWSRSEVIGKSLAELIVPPEQRLHGRGLGSYLPADETHALGRRVQAAALHRDGRRLAIERSITPVYVSGRLCYSVFMRNIEEQKRLEAKLAQAQKLESIGQLAAGIAHEINTPTQFISDNVRFLRDQYESLLGVVGKYADLIDPNSGSVSWSERAETIRSTLAELDYEFVRDEIPKAIEQSLEGLDRVTTIVRAMKDFSHPASASKAPADLNRAIESTATVCKNRWKYVADLELDFDPDLSPVPCLLAEFNQVMLNLIVNASDAITERNGGKGRGRIRIRTRSVESHVEIRIEDNGGGIPPAVRDRIFDPFFTTKGVGKGTGQGLAISRDAIVNRHGGTLEFESVAGEGTTFIVRLPLAAEQAEAEAVG